MNEISPEKVGKRIKNIRQTLGLSMSAFGKIIDSKTKSGTVSNWETGKNLPNSARLARIAQLGNMTIDELLYGSLSEVIRELMNTAYSKNLDNIDSIGLSRAFSEYTEQLDLLKVYEGNNNDFSKRQNEIALLVEKIARVKNITPNKKSQLVFLLAEETKRSFYNFQRNTEGVIDFSKNELKEALSNIQEFAYIFKLNVKDWTHTFEKITDEIDYDVADYIISIVEETISKIEKIKPH